MALEEAIDKRLITEEEAKNILASAAADLQWNRMLEDAGRNKKLQEFIKSNRWMLRQNFFDFVEMEELEFEQEKRLKALDRKMRELQDEVQHNFCILSVDSQSHPQLENYEKQTKLLERRQQAAQQVRCIVFLSNHCQSFYWSSCTV
jgi:hypothetical protein